MNYRFIGLTARFYPDIRDSEGKSLMAENGAVFDFDGLPPSDGLWVPAEDVPSEAGPVQEAPEVIQEAPEPAPAPVAPDPAPEPPAVSPEPVPVTDPDPTGAFPVATVTVPTQVSATPPAPWSFPGFAPPVQPYTR